MTARPRRAAAAAVVGLGLVALSACGGSSSETASSGGAPSSGDRSGDRSGASSGADSDESPAVAAASPTAKPGLPTLGPDRQQTDVLDRLPGSTDGACVSVGGGRDVRSGGLAAGPFDDARRTARGDVSTVRLYFIPEHSRSMPGVRVTGTNEQNGATFRRSQGEVADADQFRFYDVQVPATSGTWQIRASAGRDSGCWTVDLG